MSQVTLNVSAPQMTLWLLGSSIFTNILGILFLTLNQFIRKMSVVTVATLGQQSWPPMSSMNEIYLCHMDQPMSAMNDIYPCYMDRPMPSPIHVMPVGLCLHSRANSGGICTPMDLGTWNYFIEFWTSFNNVLYALHSLFVEQVGI